MSSKLNEFDIEAKTSGGAVFEQGVKESKRNKGIRRRAQPLMEKHWTAVQEKNRTAADGRPKKTFGRPSENQKLDGRQKENRTAVR